MVDQARRREALVVVAVIVVGLLVIALVVSPRGETNPRAGTTNTSSFSLTASATGVSKATSSLSSSFGGSSTRLTSVSSSNSAAPANALLAFGQDYPFRLFATPSVIMNYSFTITPVDSRINNVTLSVGPTLPGVSVALNPMEFTFQGHEEAIDMQISVAQTVNATNIPVNIIATTNMGVTNYTFPFSLEKQWVVVLLGTGQLIKPATLNAAVGQQVSWFDNVAINDDGYGYVTINFNDGSASSPTLTQYDSWSHMFAKPGTYSYVVNELGYGSATGTIIVT